MKPTSILVVLVVIAATSESCTGQGNRGRRQEYVSRNSGRYVTTSTSRPSWSSRSKYGQEGNSFDKSSSSVAKRREADRIIFPGDVIATTAGSRITNPGIREAIVSNEIPLSLYRKITRLNTSDFYTNFVQVPPEALGVLDRSNPGRSSGEEGPVQGRNQDIPFAEPAVCTPQPTTVPIELIKEPYVLYFPSCTRVNRCGGCCSHELLECAPTKKDNVTLQVYKTRYLGPGINKFDIAENVLVKIEQHFECECQCRVKNSDCLSNQVYRPNECRCECLNEDEASSCVGERFWDSSTCACGCREYRDCSTGLFFNKETCMCELSRVSRMGHQSPRFRDFSDKK